MAHLSSIGIDMVRVLAQLRVGIISTGDELLVPGQEHSGPGIYDSNGPPALFSLFSSYRGGILPRYYGPVRDSEDEIGRALQRSMAENHITVVSGGTSVGRHDLVREIVARMEPGIVFHGIRVRPGMPTLLALNGGDHPVIGLPGFPVSSTMMLTAVFLEPILRCAGYSTNQPLLQATMARAVSPSEGKTLLVPVKVTGKPGRMLAHPIQGLSGSISRLADVDGFVELDSPVGGAGESVGVRLYRQNLGGGEGGIVACSVRHAMKHFSAQIGGLRVVPMEEQAALDA